MYQEVASPIGDTSLTSASDFWGRILPAILLAVGILGGFGGFAPVALAKEAPGKIATIPVADLPKETRETLGLIRRGGPFPYTRDGTVFANRESRLPYAPRGHYREYTVRTPGSRDRGARRLIHSARGDFYYTADHYRTFLLILE